MSTSLEKGVIQAFIQVAGDDWEGIADDLGSAITDAQELSRLSGIPMNQIRGVIASLVKKGVLYFDDCDDSTRLPCLYWGDDWLENPEFRKEYL